LISSILTTREIALAVWILILAFIFSLDKNVRGAMKNLLKCFFVASILFSIIALAIYVTIVTLGLSLFGLWTSSLLKDTIIWSVTVAFVMQMNARLIAKRCAQCLDSTNDLLTFNDTIHKNWNFTVDCCRRVVFNWSWFHHDSWTSD
jgi:hypothetical protein